MHSEYQVPGGKLVAADIDIRDGRLRNVSLSGDFFVEPDGALEAVAAALDGLPAVTDADGLARAARAALPPDAVLLGVDADALARAVRRAAVHADDRWRLPWQLVDGPAYPERLQMALDEVLAGEVAAGRRPPTLRFWERTEPAVIIGRFQSLANEVDLAEAARLGVRVARRITGGGAMFVEPGSFVTYSIYAPQRMVSGLSLIESYELLDSWAVQGLRGMGVDARFQPVNDITSPQGKIGGAAQKRFGDGVLLHHTTMSYDMDAQKMAQVLRVGREKISDKGIASADRRVDPLRRQTGLGRARVILLLQEEFRARHGLADGALRSTELAAARRLVLDKFGTDAWLHIVP